MNTSNSAQLAKRAGVSVQTIQRWDREDRLKPAARTPGNRRLYTPEQWNQVLNRASKTQQVTMASLRVSSQAQKRDLYNSSRLEGLRNYRQAIQKAMTDDQGAQDPAQSVA